MTQTTARTAASFMAAFALTATMWLMTLPAGTASSVAIISFA